MVLQGWSLFAAVATDDPCIRNFPPLPAAELPSQGRIVATEAALDHLDRVRRSKGSKRAEALTAALDVLNQALNLDGKFADAYVRRAEAQFYAGKLEADVQRVRQALRLAPDERTLAEAGPRLRAA